VQTFDGQTDDDAQPRRSHHFRITLTNVPSGEPLPQERPITDDEIASAVEASPSSQSRPQHGREEVDTPYQEPSLYAVNRENNAPQIPNNTVITDTSTVHVFEFGEIRIEGASTAEDVQALTRVAANILRGREYNLEGERLTAYDLAAVQSAVHYMDRLCPPDPRASRAAFILNSTQGQLARPDPRPQTNVTVNPTATERDRPPVREQQPSPARERQPSPARERQPSPAREPPLRSAGQRIFTRIYGTRSTRERRNILRHATDSLRHATSIAPPERLTQSDRRVIDAILFFLDVQEISLRDDEVMEGTSDDHRIDEFPEWQHRHPAILEIQETEEETRWRVARRVRPTNLHTAEQQQAIMWATWPEHQRRFWHRVREGRTDNCTAARCWSPGSDDES
jgi:hypothetical protein